MSKFLYFQMELSQLSVVSWGILEAGKLLISSAGSRDLLGVGCICEA